MKAVGQSMINPGVGGRRPGPYDIFKRPASTPSQQLAVAHKRALLDDFM